MTITVSFNGQGVALTGPYGIQRLGNTDLDVWHYPGYVVVMHGALDPDDGQMKQAVEGLLTINWGEPLPGSSYTSSVHLIRLEAGQFYPIAFDDGGERGLRWSGKDAPFWEAYASTMPPHVAMNLTELGTREVSFGPWEAKKNASGSAGVAALRVPEIARILTLARAKAMPPRLESEFTRAADELAVQRGKDGQHFYYRNQGYRPWSPRIDDGIPYQGYGASSGGFRDGLFGEPRPDSVGFGSSGLGVCDPQHLAHDQAALCALLTGNWSLAWSALCGLDATALVVQRENFQMVRAEGHALRNYGVVAGALAPYSIFWEQTDRILTDYIPSCLTVIESRHHFGRFPAPGLDDGGDTDGGHLDKKDMDPLLDRLGITDPGLRKQARQSCSSWGTAILTVGADACLRYANDLGPLPKSSYARLNRLIKVCAAFLLGPCAGKAIPKDAGEDLAPIEPPYVLWDEIAPFEWEGLPELARPIAEDGGSNFPKAVGIRFNYQAMKILEERLPKERHRKQARDLAQRIYDRADGWFNGKKPTTWMLESAWVDTPWP